MFFGAPFFWVDLVGGNGNGNGYDKSFISYWIATGLQRAPRNDGYCHGYDYDNDNGKVVNGKRHFRNGDPSPCPLPQGGRGRLRQRQNPVGAHPSAPFLKGQ
jgi:hypothetical protein